MFLQGANDTVLTNVYTSNYLSTVQYSTGDTFQQEQLAKTLAHWQHSCTDVGNK